MSNLLIIIFLALSTTVLSQCDTNAIIIDQVRASDTDGNIPFELAQHYTFYNPNCTPRNVLLVHMVGTFASPYQSVLFPKHAANNGFHVLSLKYINGQSAQTACGNSNDIDCHYKFRKEIIEGEDLSPETNVDSVNSIQNRLIRLLEYMETNYPMQNWSQFFTGDSIHWNQVILSGHSQGGGHAAVMAIDRPVQRVIMFASPNDYSHTYSQVAGWTNLPHVTQDSAYFCFNNLYDQVADYAWQYGATQNLGVAGDSTNIDGDHCPFETSHNLYSGTDFTGTLSNHGSVVHDSNVPMDGNGEPLYKNVWSYLLGIDCLPLSVLEEELNVEIYPNPSESSLSVKVNAQVNDCEISNILGEKVRSSVINDNVFNIDVSDLPNGIYTLKISTETGVYQKRFIKK
ncbi:MAG: T9SS type A sorting domain-containing protein [bacterium]|nr:T9SS type A sorting domain-containing protein [bacterium]